MKLFEYLNKHSKKHLIFDLDETLATLQIDWSGFRDSFYGLVETIDASLVKTIPNRHGSAIHLYNETVRCYGADVKREIDHFCEKWEKQKYCGLRENKQLVKFVHTNNDRYIFSIWTSNNRATAIKAIDELHLAPNIQVIVAKEDALLNKPYPDGFWSIQNTYKLQASDYLMVGNSEHDEAAAEAAGIDFLLVEPY